MDRKEVEVGTVIQVNQDAKLPLCWHGTLLIVQHVAIWGVRAGLLFPSVGGEDMTPDVAFVRIPYPEFEVIGTCHQIPQEIANEKWPIM